MIEKKNILEIASVLSEKNGLERNAANSFVADMFAIIQERLETDKIVKIKGLGTFKMIDVEPRESISVRTGERVLIAGHSKITFTPDAVIRELVNKPFSQFDTVMLKDGVSFEDMKEEYSLAADNSGDEQSGNNADGEEQSDDDDAVEDNTTVEEETIVDDTPAETAVDEETPEQDEIVADDEILEEETVVEGGFLEETEADGESDGDEDDDSYEDDETDDDEEVQVLDTRPEPHKLQDDGDDGQYPWYKLFMPAVAAVVLAALSAAGGYYVGNRQVSAYDTLIVHDTVMLVDTVRMEPEDSVVDNAPVAEDLDSPAAAEPNMPAASAETAPAAAKSKAPAAAKPKTPAAAAETPSAAAEPKVPAAAASQSAGVGSDDKADDYNNDVRVRHGAYRIVGEDRKVTVRKGQTFASICKAAFGPDMECYVEVFNGLPRNPDVKAGQVIRIPKLERKRKKMLQ